MITGSCRNILEVVPAEYCSCAELFFLYFSRVWPTLCQRSGTRVCCPLFHSDKLAATFQQGLTIASTRMSVTLCVYVCLSTKLKASKADTKLFWLNVFVHRCSRCWRSTFGHDRKRLLCPTGCSRPSVIMLPTATIAL